MTHKELNKQAPVVESKEAFVNAPLEVVWSVLTDFEQWPQWNESVSKRTGVPRSSSLNQFIERLAVKRILIVFYS